MLVLLLSSLQLYCPVLSRSEQSELVVLSIDKSDDFGGSPTSFSSKDEATTVVDVAILESMLPSWRR